MREAFKVGQVGQVGHRKIYSDFSYVSNLSNLYIPSYTYTGNRENGNVESRGYVPQIAISRSRRLRGGEVGQVVRRHPCTVARRGG